MRRDLSLLKNTNLFENSKLQLRAEAFNAFNHTNYTTVNSILGNAAYGQATAAGQKRVLQVGAKYTF